MVAPTPAGMDKCDPKCKCPSGPYTDQAFVCDDPCAGQGVECVFDCTNGCICEAVGGTWKIEVTRTSQYQRDPIQLDCFVNYFLDPYFDNLGRSVRKVWVYRQTPWPGYPGEGSAFDLIEPNGPQIGYPLEPGGELGPSVPVSGSTVTSICILSASYCANDNVDFAGHNNGMVGWRLLYDESYVGRYGGVPGQGLNIAGCDGDRTATVEFVLTYLGPGEPFDYYEICELGVEDFNGYRRIIDCATDLKSCQDPSKSP